MQVIICYDVSKDSRRARLLRFLKNFLEHVQKSVFEGDIDEARFHKMRQGIPGIIDMGNDTVRIYRICRRCTSITEVVGTGVRIDETTKEFLI